MISKYILKLRKLNKLHKIDGYIIPKNDAYFSEFSYPDRLKKISNFTGSAGYAIILKKKNYLFVDGRYTIQAKIESGKNFTVIQIPNKSPQDIFKRKIRKITLGFDPQLFTSFSLKKKIGNLVSLKPIKENLIDKLFREDKNIPVNKFYALNPRIVGESFKSKINRLIIELSLRKIDNIFISAPENVAWLLNIRGKDNPFSPIPNCKLILTKNKKLYFFSCPKKISRIRKNLDYKNLEYCTYDKFTKIIKSLKGNNFCIDKLTCSIFNEKIIKSKFRISLRDDPCYLLKSIKNQSEIKNMISAHIKDGAALTKFIYWIKNLNKKKITEIDAQQKLESFRKLSGDYLFPSFNTIAGTGANGAIVHYRAQKKTTKEIKKNHIFLCDSGGQYKYGTTDVTRTICFSKPPKSIQNIFTKVLKGHIAVATTDLKKNFNGKLIDYQARKFLKKSSLDYEHGTGHGVGFFSNVHEGPQSISKYNNIKIREGMILSNEPGYYKKGHFGIRIENLLYVKKLKKGLFFENLTLAPIDKELINFYDLNKKEKNYLFNYHLNIYSKLSKYLNKNEKKWLASFI